MRDLLLLYQQYYTIYKRMTGIFFHSDNLLNNIQKLENMIVKIKNYINPFGILQEPSYNYVFRYLLIVLGLKSIRLTIILSVENSM